MSAIKSLIADKFDQVQSVLEDFTSYEVEVFASGLLISCNDDEQAALILQALREQEMENTQIIHNMLLPCDIAVSFTL